VETAGTRMQLADPFGGQAAGQVLFEGVEVTPGAPAQPLVTLIGRLQGLLDPRFGVGDKVVLMRVREQPVRVWLHNRRIWHEGLVMDMGQLTVRTSGSVAADGTLAMDVEMAFRGDIAGQTPIVATLLRTPLLIPLKGTIDRPQFDASAIDKIFARIAANTANAVIGDGISRGLEAIFGNPPPPAPPQ
jgi:translocation and assembly module TamB